jgi:hypothetical protein
LHNTQGGIQITIAMIAAASKSPSGGNDSRYDQQK